MRGSGAPHALEVCSARRPARVQLRHMLVVRLHGAGRTEVASTASTMQRFSGRNVSFLRVSRTTIVRMVLYLDQRHIQWMNSHPEILDRVVGEVLKLQYVSCANAGSRRGSASLRTARATAYR